MKKFKFLCTEDKIYYIIINVIITVMFAIILYPCVFVLSASFSSGDAVMAGKVLLFPVDLSLEGYSKVFSMPDIITGYRNSLFYTVVGTAINLFVTILCAYPLSRRDLPGRNFIMLYFAFVMYFGGGLIPTYMVVRGLHMTNTIWALLIPGALNVYNMIMMRTFIQSNIPLDLLEASMLDGCSDITYMTKVVLPLSKAIIAVLVLFYGVGHWNAYFDAMIYLHKAELYPLTIFMREILLLDNFTLNPSDNLDPELATILSKMAGVIKYALIVVSMVPVLMVYPFIQKYFVKGVMVGSIKG